MKVRVKEVVHQCTIRSRERELEFTDCGTTWSTRTPDWRSFPLGRPTEEPIDCMLCLVAPREERP